MSKPPAASGIARAIYHTVAYADIFDYPLTIAEIQRYLIGIPASLDEIHAGIENASSVHQLTRSNGYISLADRQAIIDTRQQREAISNQLWPLARHYGQIIGRLPFVRMVAVTGSLAVNNVGDRPDIDYLIVTEPGRLWLCRMLVIGLVKWAARQGVTLCPNYFVSETHLMIQERNLFTAREVTQMVPLVGFETYHQFRHLNAWTQEYVPNADGYPDDYTVETDASAGMVRSATETLLRTPLGGWLDRWEMNRKIRKLSRQGALDEVEFTPDVCKGHFDQHQQRILAAFDDRVGESDRDIKAS